jgi:hypothetical protein
MMITPTPAVREMVVKELRNNRLMAVVARRYDLPLSKVRQIADEEGLTVRKKKVRLDLTNRHTDEVPERLRPFVVHIKRVTEGWPDSEAILNAREAYDAGTVEICTGRLSGETDLLYLCVIPRKKPVTREPYFSANYEG